jgi:hypothetical protein
MPAEARPMTPSAPLHRAIRTVGVVLLLAIGGPLALGDRTRAFDRAAPDPVVNVLLDKAAAYLDGYQKSFAAVVAQETYVQTSTGRPPRRELRSDVMEMNLGEAEWSQFRDVYEVDGKKVRDHDSRLENLFMKPTMTSLSEATRIANESARYNLGVARTINVPTMALTYLMKPSSSGRSSMRRSTTSSRAVRSSP